MKWIIIVRTLITKIDLDAVVESGWPASDRHVVAVGGVDGGQLRFGLGVGHGNAGDHGEDNKLKENI